MMASLRVSLTRRMYLPLSVRGFHICPGTSSSRVVLRVSSGAKPKSVSKRLGGSSCCLASGSSSGENDNNDASSSSSSSSSDNISSRLNFTDPSSEAGGGHDPNPTEALIASLGEVSASADRNEKHNSRVAVFGCEDELEKWKLLDAEVNTYPMLRTFKAMASADDGQLVKDLVTRLNNVEGLEVDAAKHVSIKPSSKGNYQSISFGPLLVSSGEQVIDIFAELKAEQPRVRYVI
ncbi:hypothetical protein RI054_38g142820 [Pseudoscourfieldia marina]